MCRFILFSCDWLANSIPPKTTICHEKARVCRGGGTNPERCYAIMKLCNDGIDAENR